jgi:outer membrane biosynthesis protein TonB
MPPTQSPIEPGQPTPEQDSSESQTSTPVPTHDSSAPLSFVPHDPTGQVPVKPIRIRTNRYGELEEHELVRLLDSIEDERARGRFRESIYISVFIWLIVAWVLFYGPRYLWHAPVLVSPADVLKNRELTQLNLPVLTSRAPSPRPAPKPRSVDNRTLEHLRTMAREAPPKPPTPAPAPMPTAPTPINPPPTTPIPATPQPQPRTPAPALADAPTPQPSSRPDFNTNSGTAGDNIRNAERGAASAGGGGGFARSPSKADNLGGVEVLSDMQGVDFSEYLRRLKADIYRNWIPLLPEETQPPLSKSGETYIRFTILPDGRIGAMHLEGSTHDDAINKAAWGSITSEGQFPPLPSKFHGPNLELRFLYLVNEPLR